jgi:glycine cleavage system aminomethyltransferase T
MTTPDPAKPRETPLRGVHDRLGASMTDFAGWLMPLRYRSETAEHQAVRSAAGLFDLSHMGEISVRGPGAAAALDYALTGELSAVPAGRARYTMICAADGGILDDLIVYRLAGQDFLVVANAANTAVVLAALTERHPGAGRGGHPRPAGQCPAGRGPVLRQPARHCGRPGHPAGPDRVHRRRWFRAVHQPAGRGAHLVRAG